MNTYIDNKQIYITPIASNNLTLLNGTKKSHIQIYIPNLITNENKSILYHTVKVCHLEIPYSFYVINEYNNQFVINNTPIEIPLGNYNALTLQDTINDLFSDYGFNGYSLSFDTTNGKYTLMSSEYFYVNSSSIKNVVGLDDEIYNSIFDFNLEQYVLEFPYLVNTSGTKNIYIKTNIITNNINTSNGDANIIKAVAVDVPPFGVIMYSNNQNVETLVRNREMNNLEIQLLDDNLQPINFNNLDWSITIEFKTIYQLIMNKTNIDDFFNQVQN